MKEKVLYPSMSTIKNGTNLLSLKMVCILLSYIHLKQFYWNYVRNLLRHLKIFTNLSIIYIVTESHFQYKDRVLVLCVRMKKILTEPKHFVQTFSQTRVRPECPFWSTHVKSRNRRIFSKMYNEVTVGQGVEGKMEGIGVVQYLANL